MKIGFNARLLHAPELRGWNRYTINLMSELTRLGTRLVLYSHKPVHPSYLERLVPGSFEQRVSPALPYLAWEQGWLPFRCARDRVDVLHSPFNFGLPWAGPCPKVLTLHDAIDRVYYEPLRPLRDRFARRALESSLYHWSARRTAGRVITVSEHSREDLMRHLGIPADRIDVVYEAADPLFERPVSAAESERVRTVYRLERPYVFYVGGWEKRKNLPFLLRALAQASLKDVELVLAGRGKSEELRTLAAELGLADRVRFLGHVDDADLPALYAGALAFAYPSEYEGFGLQLCEAMATGCPTLAARATCLPEILGTGGETFSLEDPSELAGLLRRLAGSEAFRSELGTRARARAREFSWKRAAERTLEIYHGLTPDRK